MDNIQKAIEAIEAIVSDDFCFDMEWDLMEERLLTVRERIATEKLLAVYRIAHAHAGRCGNAHEDWRVKEKAV